MDIGLLTRVEGRVPYPQATPGYAQRAQQPLLASARDEVQLSTVSTGPTKEYLGQLGVRLTVIISSLEPVRLSQPTTNRNRASMKSSRRLPVNGVPSLVRNRVLPGCAREQHSLRLLADRDDSGANRPSGMLFSVSHTPKNPATPSPTAAPLVPAGAYYGAQGGPAFQLVIQPDIGRDA